MRRGRAGVGVPLVLPMTVHFANRRMHYWVSAAIALPVLVVLSTGLLLQLKKQIPWVQPVEHKGSGKVPVVPLDQIGRAATQSGDASPVAWEQIDRIDVRPGKGIAKVILESGVEVQVDTTDGRVLSREVRRSDWIESLHDGSFFGGDTGKLGVFLPSAVGLLVLWISGIWMFVLPWVVRARKRRRTATREG
jgi:uncharacterized iron-regulated membrane protein